MPVKRYGRNLRVRYINQGGNPKKLRNEENKKIGQQTQKNDTYKANAEKTEPTNQSSTKGPVVLALFGSIFYSSISSHVRFKFLSSCLSATLICVMQRRCSSPQGENKK